MRGTASGMTNEIMTNKKYTESPRYSTASPTVSEARTTHVVVSTVTDNICWLAAKNGSTQVITVVRRNGNDVRSGTEKNEVCPGVHSGSLRGS